MPKSGEPPRKYLRKAELHVQLKPGTLGVKVSLLPPDAQFPDKVTVHTVAEEIELAPEQKIEVQATEEKLIDSEGALEEISNVDTHTSEHTTPSEPESVESDEKVSKKESLSADLFFLKTLYILSCVILHNLLFCIFSHIFHVV